MPDSRITITFAVDDLFLNDVKRLVEAMNRDELTFLDEEGEYHRFMTTGGTELVIE